MITTDQLVALGYNVMFEARKIFSGNGGSMKRIPLKELLPKGVSDTFLKKAEGRFILIYNNGHDVCSTYYDDSEDKYFIYSGTDTKIHKSHLMRWSKFEEHESFYLGYSLLNNIIKDKDIDFYYRVENKIVKRNDVVKALLYFYEDEEGFEKFHRKEVVLKILQIHPQDKIFECKVANEPIVLNLYPRNISCIQKYPEGKELFKN